MRMRIRSLIPLTLTVGLLASAAYANGKHENDSNEVKYRHTVMEAMGNQFGAIVMVFTKRVDQPDNLKVHAKALADTATVASTLFPPGSEGGEALPIIWEEPDRFAAAMDDLVKKTAALSDAADSGDQAAMAAAFKAAGESCKGCHERYKEEDK